MTGIRGGNSVSIEAKSGDINSHGAKIVAGYDENGLLSGGAGDISLKAGNDINLESAQATNSSSSSSKSAGASIGYSVGIGLGQGSGGWTGSANASSGKSNSNGTTQVNTHVTGSGNINIESGRDTNLKGAVVEGETITANVGRDLNIISVPDTGESSNKSSSFGVSGSLSGGTPKVTGVSPGFGTGSGETNWIGEQSGLVSKGEMDVRVEGNTHLGAGKIVSESGDLKLGTGTLTHEDFSGSKKYEGFDIQANIDLTGKEQQPDQTSQPKNSAEGTYQLDDTRQEVRATVGPGEIIIRDKDKQAELEASGQTEDLAALNRDPDKAYEITKDKHVEIEYYLSDTSVKAALEAGQTLAETFGNALDRMVKDGKRTPEQAALSKEMFPFLDDPNVRAALAQCAQQHGAVDFSIFSWMVPSAHAQTGCAIPINGQIKYFSPTQAGTCLSDYDQLTGVVRGMISATGVTIAALAGAFLLASTTAAGGDINKLFKADDGTSVVLKAKHGDIQGATILVTYPDGTTASLDIEYYGEGGAVRLTSGTIGTLPLTPSQLKDMGYVLTNAGLPNVVMSSNGNGDHQYFPKPKTEEITGFPGLREVKGTGGRARWIDEKGKIYEWDRQHGKLEVYDKTGKKHLGEFDPKTGEQTKPGDPGRSIKK